MKKSVDDGRRSVIKDESKMLEDSGKIGVTFWTVSLFLKCFKRIF